MNKIKVGVLGATGMVGQTLVSMLTDHPWFELTEVAASERSSGKNYEEATSGRWNINTDMPDAVRNMKLKECKPNLDCELVFSALDSSVAAEIELDFATAGYAVSSNAKNHRMEDDVPLIIPEVNAGHLELIKAQRKARGWKGLIVTDPNCSTIGMCLVLKPLMDSFGLEKVMVTTMQALSGAGYPGVASLDIFDNVIPFISGEEEKMEEEPLKIFGSMGQGAIKNADMVISAHCNRVAVRHGHTECVNVKLAKQTDIKEITKVLESFNPLKAMGLPSAPKRPIIVTSQHNRPQPKMDVEAEKGMASVVGRIRKCEILDYKFTLLSHNLIRGAAGAAILNAELLKAKGYIGK
jgi:aspartate-semialdehyde dehydrogenase